MKKDDVKELHENVVNLARFLEEEDGAEFSITAETDKKSKKEMMRDIFSLCGEIAEHFSDDEYSDMGRLRERMEEHELELAKSQ